jgi:hypothetical protein
MNITPLDPADTTRDFIAFAVRILLMWAVNWIERFTPAWIDVESFLFWLFPVLWAFA